mmetsp:Transcript_35708/g.60392  ORF Transcript_35708/g.60392 Transcript_35708/m.60392 type:complete len:203 (-) Transcript_35708:190-798(-)
MRCSVCGGGTGDGGASKSAPSTTSSPQTSRRVIATRATPSRLRRMRRDDHGDIIDEYDGADGVVGGAGINDVVDNDDDDDDDDEKEDDDDDDEAKKGTVSLRQLLYGEGYHGYFEGCTGCGGDGTQRFCFCMNRAVNSNYVNHCFSCGKCFYTRHGTMRCSHCKALEPGIEEYFGRKEESKWAWEIPDEMEAGLASEGYWGF